MTYLELPQVVFVKQRLWQPYLKGISATINASNLITNRLATYWLATKQQTILLFL